MLQPFIYFVGNGIRPLHLLLDFKRSLINNLLEKMCSF